VRTLAANIEVPGVPGTDLSARQHRRLVGHVKDKIVRREADRVVIDARAPRSPRNYVPSSTVRAHTLSRVIGS